MKRELELAVINPDVHALVFPCFRTESGWINASSNKPNDVSPTHWRWWPIAPYFCCCG